MQTTLKHIKNNGLAELSQQAPHHILGAIQTASAKTGVDFAYLIEKAAAESNFSAKAKAKTSSASGLFQFIESTWLHMVKKHGNKYGISSDQKKADILQLRNDPKISSFMAAEFAKENKEYLQKHVKGSIGNTELYFAHFMGAGGAAAFLNQLKKNPLSIGADLFPKESKVNNAVFYDRKTGQARTLGQIYEFFDKKFSNQKQPVQEKPTSYAHKSKEQERSLQNINKTNSVELSYLHHNSLFDVQRHVDAYFSQSYQVFPNSFYGNLSNPTAMLLSILDS